MTKFSCDRCGRRLSTREDPIPGHVYRVACRCGHVLFFRGSEPATPPPPAPAPPPLPWGRIRGPAVIEQRAAEPVSAPPLPPPVTARASPPELPLLATTSMLILDETPSIPVVLASHAHWRVETLAAAAREWLVPRAARLVESARASLAAGVAAWRRGRVGFGTLLVASVVSACAAASLTAWLMMVVSRPRLSTIAFRAEPPSTAPLAPAPAVPAGGDRAIPATRPPRQAPAAAPTRPLRRAEHHAALLPEVEVRRDAAGPDLAGGGAASPASRSAAPLAPAEASEPAARDDAGATPADDAPPAPAAGAPERVERVPAAAPTGDGVPKDGAPSDPEAR